jgi:type IV secretion system protein VirB11
MNEGGVYLAHYLSALAPVLERSDVTDIYVNRPQEIWVETLGGTIERHDVPALDASALDRLARQIAAMSHQGINREHPILSASLPDGARVQIIMPPATRGAMAMAIRKHVVADMGIDHYEAGGAFDYLRETMRTPRPDLHQQLRTARDKGNFAGLLKMAVHGRCNLLVSGGTSSGKTTFLNALIREIDNKERLILIEDTPELALRHPNATGLIAARSALGEAVVTMEDLLNASLRMRPDRIILGELRGPEAFTFLRAVNTGHPGSMTTVHADSPARAVEQIVLLILQSGARLDRESIRHYVEASIDVFVQLGRSQGRRYVTAIEVRS